MHGGDIYRNRVRIDFSVNTNPLGCPGPVMEAMEESLKTSYQYPDPDCELLAGALAEHFKTDATRLVCGNGASELIMAIVRALRPQMGLVPAPGFSGYERALRAGGVETISYRGDVDEIIGGLEHNIKDRVLVFLTNPSNPSGQLTRRAAIMKLLEACRAYGAYLVVDECFMELTTDPGAYTLTGLVSEYKELIILRAFTKSFAIPSIRLGYCLCGAEEVAGLLKDQLPEWNVSGPAQAAGLAGLNCGGFLRKSAAYIEDEKAYLYTELEKLGFILTEGSVLYADSGQTKDNKVPADRGLTEGRTRQVYRSTANYLLIYVEEIGLYEKLLAKGLLIRDCSDYEGLGRGYYRLAVRSRRDNEELIKEIGVCLNENGT